MNRPDGWAIRSIPPMHYVIRMSYDANLGRQDYMTRFKTFVTPMTYFQAVSRPGD